METLDSYAILFSGIHGILLTMVLFFWKRNKKANRVFSLLVLTVSLNFLSLYASNHDWDSLFFSIIELNPGFVIGPLVYTYIRILTGGSHSTAVKNLIHFIPALLSLFPGGMEWDGCILIIEDFHTMAYLGASLWMIKNFRADIEGYLSSIDMMRLRWLITLFIGFTLFRLYSLTEAILLTRGIRIPLEIDRLSLIIESLTIYIISYFILSQREVFDGVLSREIKRENRSKPGRPDFPFMEETYGQLLHLMEDEELYLQNSITLKDLADRMGLPPYQLSQLLNTRTGSNFFSFINGYRVRKACQILMTADSRQMTMLEIAFDSGFNSKTTFNEVFKRVTGMTPTEYRRQKQKRSP